MGNRLKFIIYMLVDPRTDAPRYIGKSCYGMGRPRRHAVLAAKEKTRKACWIRELLALGLTYKIVVLEHCHSHEDVIDAEGRWLLAGKRLGWPLTNDPGAELGPYHRREMSAETRAKISAAKRGKSRPDLRGKPRPDLTAINQRGKSKETRAKISASLIGNTRGTGFEMSASHRKTMSDLRKQEWSAEGWRRTASPDGLRRG
jgi:hypothetical protein